MLCPDNNFCYLKFKDNSVEENRQFKCLDCLNKENNECSKYFHDMPARATAHTNGDGKI